jgi:S-adenosylmethionine-diacylgycerolhomoserine-N-methlytransferase
MSDRATDHAHLMDRVYRYQRYIYNFTRKYYLFGRDRLIGRLALAPGDSLVEIGCGTARNLIAIARRYPGVRLYGVDASSEMLRTAAKAISGAGLGDRILLSQGYAESVSAEALGEPQGFQHVLFSYSISMIPDWKQALQCALDCLSPRGQLHIVDFGDLAGCGPVRPVLNYWLNLFHVSPRLELLQLLESSVPDCLSFLPGRYAFLLSAGRERFMDAAEPMLRSNHNVRVIS